MPRSATSKASAPRTAVSVTIDRPVHEVAELAMSRSGASRWLGAPEGEPLRPGAEVALPGDSAVRGIVTAVDRRAVEVQTSGGATRIEFRRASRYTTVASVAPSPCELVDDARLTRAWRGALFALDRLCGQAGDRRLARQAVVVIHGIGEQKPGSVLRGFVAGVVDDPVVLSQPDEASGDYELRRLQVFQTETRPRTDFYELYWADKVRDTTRSQVLGWIRALAMRRPSRLPKRFRPIWWTAALTLVLLAVAVRGGMPEWAAGDAAAFAAPILTGILTGFLIHSVGDAARYLAVRPDNLAIRRDIRTAGVDLLRQLHDSGRYHRVVMVGHSLGSVIGYDVLRLYWAEVHDRIGPPHGSASAAIDAYEAGADTASPVDGQALQHDLWLELRDNGVPWLVTDFVTAGSPITHAELLLANGQADLAARIADREMPTSPPQRDRKKDGSLSDRKYSYPLGSHYALHHGALFGPVRWTNLYFPTAGVVFGDGVGGEIAPVLGRGVRDVAVTTAEWVRRRTPKAHSSYWFRGKPVTGSTPQARQAMVDALALDCADALQEAADRRPLSLFLPDR